MQGQGPVSIRLVPHRTARLCFILSAKHGLVDPEEVLDPYDKTLHKMSEDEQRDWADQVLEKLLALDDRRFVFLAGAKYREHLVAQLDREGREADVPMERMRIGKQLRWLTTIANH